MTWQFADLWDEALPFGEFVERAAGEHKPLWQAIYRLARVPAWALEQREPLRLVVLAEDWCGDAVNTVPVLAKWAEQSPAVELRILRRDDYPAVMDRYLTNGAARSIPVVVVLNEAMDELGWWGPRPAGLQQFVEMQLKAGRAKTDIYPETRRWYAKDHGESAIRDLLAVAGCEVAALV